MVVPYGSPDPLHAWKSAFDAGEWGLGRMANSLTLGCDCLGEIRYFDDVWADEKAKPRTRANAICMHEEDYGILWKHVDMVSGRTEVRRSRRLVVSSIATVGNYEYGFYWYFYLDGTLQLEVKLTGIMSTMAVADGDAGRTPSWWRPGWRRRTTSTCSTCGSTSRSTAPTTGLRGRRRPRRARRARREPVGQRLRHDGDAARARAGGPPRRRPVAQPHLAHRQPLAPQRRRRGPAYKLLPASTPTLLAHPDSSVGRAPRSPPTTCGSRRSTPRSAGPPATTRTRTAAAPASRVDGAGPPDRRHRRRAVAHVRRHAHPAPRGLAGDAGRVHRLHAGPLRLLRPQPGARRPAVGRPLP